MAPNFSRCPPPSPLPPPLLSLPSFHFSLFPARPRRAPLLPSRPPSPSVLVNPAGRVAARPEAGRPAKPALPLPEPVLVLPVRRLAARPITRRPAIHALLPPAIRVLVHPSIRTRPVPGRPAKRTRAPCHPGGRQRQDQPENNQSVCSHVSILLLKPLKIMIRRQKSSCRQVFGDFPTFALLASFPEKSSIVFISFVPFSLFLHRPYTLSPHRSFARRPPCRPPSRRPVRLSSAPFPIPPRRMRSATPPTGRGRNQVTGSRQ